MDSSLEIINLCTDSQPSSQSRLYFILESLKSDNLCFATETELQQEALFMASCVQRGLAAAQAS